MLKEADKSLFVALRDDKITFNQFKARMLARTKKLHYECLEDVKGIVEDEEDSSDLKEIGEIMKLMHIKYGKKKPLTFEELMKDDSWGIPTRCLKSIYSLKKRPQSSKHPGAKSRGLP
jgi:hypothetical protein